MVWHLRRWCFTSQREVVSIPLNIKLQLKPWTCTTLRRVPKNKRKGPAYGDQRKLQIWRNAHRWILPAAMVEEQHVQLDLAFFTRDTPYYFGQRNQAWISCNLSSKLPIQVLLLHWYKISFNMAHSELWPNFWCDQMGISNELSSSMNWICCKVLSIPVPWGGTISLSAEVSAGRLLWLCGLPSHPLGQTGEVWSVREVRTAPYWVTILIIIVEPETVVQHPFLGYDICRAYIFWILLKAFQTRKRDKERDGEGGERKSTFCFELQTDKSSYLE